MPSDEWFTEIHQRLLDGDPIAPAELATEVFGDLIREITAANRVNDPGLVQDACSEAWENYVKNPTTFKPSERSLFGYLKMSAQGDLRNRLAKEARRRKQENTLDGVELTVFDGNEQAESEIESQWADIQRRLESVFDDPADIRAARLIIDGERATSAFVEVYDLQDMSETDQKREVKRHKDRLKKRMQRSMELQDE